MEFMSYMHTHTHTYNTKTGDCTDEWMNGERVGQVQLVSTPTEGPVTAEHRQV